MTVLKTTTERTVLKTATKRTVATTFAVAVVVSGIFFLGLVKMEYAAGSGLAITGLIFTGIGFGYIRKSFKDALGSPVMGVVFEVIGFSFIIGGLLLALS